MKLPQIKPFLQSVRVMYLLADLGFLVLILAIGWFLIGSYAHFDYLRTGYQDWMYQAFRVQSIQQHGFTSWDHIWSNGINYWRVYQYLPHLITLGLVLFFKIGISKAMIILMITIFLLTRVLIYGLLRKLRVSPLIACVMTVLTYTMAQQWISIKEYSIFFFVWLIPIFVYFWIMAFKKRQYIYLLTAFAGASWSLHPLLGLTFSGLVGFLYLFAAPNKTWKQLFLLVVLFFSASAPFTVSYLSAGYHFTNPIYQSAQYLQQTVVSDSYGLSFYYLALLAVCWVLTFILTGQTDRWSRILLLFCTSYLLVILAGQAGYLPTFINQFQVSRGIVMLGFILPFIYADNLFIVSKKLGKNTVATLVGIFIAVLFTMSVANATTYMADPVQKIINPVAEYFSTHPIGTGSVFFDNVSEASFFSPAGVRFVTSYNEHLQPSPLSTRFRSLLKNDVVYTGISSRQATLLSAYSDVLGVQYFFLSNLSPLAQYIVSDSTLKNQFVEKEVVQNGLVPAKVIENTHPVFYAYLIQKEDVAGHVHFTQLKKPTLLAGSYQVWDDEVVQLQPFLRSTGVIKLPVQFIDTNKIKITFPESIPLDQKALLLQQSYDDGWKSESGKIFINATSLRMMFINDLTKLNGRELLLVNSWPSWYWPVQFLGVITISATVIGGFLVQRIKRKKHD